MIDINGKLYDPPQISAATVKSIEASKNNPSSMSLGLPGMDKFVMTRKNKVIGLLADTSQCKTSTMTDIARNLAKQIDANNNEIGVFITWEDTIEDFGLADFANFSKIPMASLYHGDVKDYEFKRLLRASAERAKTPLWLIGQSEANNSQHGRLTMTDVFEILDHIQNVQKKTIRFAMLDFLQRINRDDMRKEGDTRMQYSGVMDKVKDLAMDFHPATFIGTQVSRSKVESSKWRQPQIHWAMETSNFEHTCDGAFSLWYPIKSKDVWSEGECLQAKQGVNGTAINVRKETLLVEILKQKKAESGGVVAMDFIPEYNMFVPYGKADEEREVIKQTYLDDFLQREDDNA
jgi:replicative DNA helicase